jgi:phosphate uptake regulator
MDKLAKMQEEMFMAGQCAALKSVHPMLKNLSTTLSKMSDDIEQFLFEADPEYKQEVEDKQKKSDEERAMQLSQFTNRVVANLENVKNN